MKHFMGVLVKEFSLPLFLIQLLYAVLVLCGFRLVSKLRRVEV